MLLCKTSLSGLFLQVRRMTGAMVAVGQGLLSVPQLKKILEARESLAYPQGMAAPAHGLFLTRVDYRNTGENKNQLEQQGVGRGVNQQLPVVYILC